MIIVENLATYLEDVETYFENIEEFCEKKRINFLRELKQKMSKE